ncbi:MAG: NUDIX hydrolase [Halobacteria archaeon]|nr:NUDIX hydrolase [Halobacteria archaeon]
MHRQELLGLLTRHDTRFMDEASFVARARAFVEANTDVFDREHLPAHVTGSAWVVSPDFSQALIMHHVKQNQWFQPGGHADGDADILRVALRETAEETGIDPEHVQLLTNDVFDVDIHVIPGSEHGPWHEHIDIRFLVQIDNRLPVPGNDESHEVLWVDLREASAYNNNRSTWRMVEKTRRLRSALMHGEPVDSKNFWAARRAEGVM